MICGTVGRYSRHLEQVQLVVGLAEGARRLTSMSGVVLHAGTLFVADAQVQTDPDAEALAEITLSCAREVRRFGVEPRVALLSHSNFGSHGDPAALKMHRALELIRAAAPGLEVEGEMRADLALLEHARRERFPESALDGAANLLIMPNLDAANIAFNLIRVIGEGIVVGPMLLGAAKSAHVVTQGITVRGLLNMTALAAVRAQ
jgi:malate dehydrogenase (oxaloacetate-decarboxylating)(NADP+)